MTATIIDGNAVAREIRAEVARDIDRLTHARNRPGLAVVLVGEDPGSVSYVRGKTRDAQEIGIRSETIRLPASTTQAELLRVVDELNENPAWHGILVQLPLPSQISESAVIAPRRIRKGRRRFDTSERRKAVSRRTSAVPLHAARGAGDPHAHR